jgi:rhomboid family GlyGly-CTERM serine protease
MVEPYSSLRLPLAVAALVLLLLAWPAAGTVLEYRRALLPEQPWRLLTGQLVHLNGAHALANVLALVLLGRMFAGRLAAGRQAVALTAGLAAVGIGLWLAYPQVAWYRGLSGALHALFVAGFGWLLLRGETPRLRLLAALMLALVVAKLLAESAFTTPVAKAAWLGATVVPPAHALGALAGSVVALAWAVQDRRRQQ